MTTRLITHNYYNIAGTWTQYVLPIRCYVAPRTLRCVAQGPPLGETPCNATCLCYQLRNVAGWLHFHSSAICPVPLRVSALSLLPVAFSCVPVALPIATNALHYQLRPNVTVPPRIVIYCCITSCIELHSGHMSMQLILPTYPPSPVPSEVALCCNTQPVNNDVQAGLPEDFLFLYVRGYIRGRSGPV